MPSSGKNHPFLLPPCISVCPETNASPSTPSIREEHPLESILRCNTSACCGVLPSRLLIDTYSDEDGFDVLHDDNHKLTEDDVRGVKFIVLCLP